MADLYTIPNVTVFGANGGVQLVGVASADMISIAFSDDYELVEQHNGVNVVTGVVAHNQKGNVNLTFYPIPLASAVTIGTSAIDLGVDVRDANDWKAITLPNPLDAVYVYRNAPSTSPGQVPDVIASGSSTGGQPKGGTNYRTYHYVGGGSMVLTPNGLLTITLPLTRWAVIDTN